MAYDNWLPPHARVRISPARGSRLIIKRWIERCRRAVAQARIKLRQIMLMARGDTGEWDSGARGL